MKINNKWRICIAVGVAWILLVLILNIIANYNPSIQRFYPFDTNVVGTVSDWVLVIVTAVTAYFLWKTLNSQLKVQESQDVQTNAVLMGHANRYPPQITFTINHDIPTHVSPSIQGGFDIYIGICLENSGKENILALQVSGLSIKEVNPPINGEIITVNIYFIQHVKFNTKITVDNEISLSVKFNFMNSIGLKYISEYVIRCVISVEQNSTFRLNIIETETVWNPKLINFNLGANK